MRLTIAVVAAAAALGLAGCTTWIPGVSCNADSDCAAGSTCDCSTGNGCFCNVHEDAGVDAATPAGPDAAVPCTAGAACALAGGAGLCKAGVCAACAGSADDLACSTAYGAGAGYVCVSGSCVKGNCSTDGDCAQGQICGLAGPALCSPCQSDEQCKSDQGYGGGTLCANGLCVAGDCHASGECPQGELCRANTCAGCATAEECRNDARYGKGHVCVAGNCVPGDCVASKDCPQGEICSAKTSSPNVCVGCTSDGECTSDARYGHGTICASGACVKGDCHSDADCVASGRLCLSHVCTACVPDSDCQSDTTYGPATICVAGACLKGNCRTDETCSGKLCKQYSCTSCASDADCVNETSYGPGYLCSQGVCLKASCTTDKECGAGQICTGGKCTQCTLDTECAADTTSYGKDYICASGTCVKGNCHSDAECQGQLCESYNCKACSTTSDCLSAPYYGPMHVCIAGACVPGDCLSSGDCTGGGVCDAKNLCANCTGDDQCRSDAFYGAQWGTQTICVQGACVQGNCGVDGDCPLGQICGLDVVHTCAACITDLECQLDASYGLLTICQGGICLVGDCHASSDCSGRLCSSSHLCADCTATTDCAAAPPAGYGSGYVCVGGTCEQGNCASDSDCAPGEICGKGGPQVCGGCGADQDCVGDRGYGAGFVCIGELCLAGNCHDSSSCDVASPGQLCGGQLANYCGKCSASSQCQADAWYAGKFGQTVCLNGACIRGDCLTSSDCHGGQLCLGNRCSPCTGDPQCVNDPFFGPGWLCFSGACGRGDCHGDQDCSGRICGLQAVSTCGDCTSDAQCQGDAFYGPNTICTTASGAGHGTCVANGCGPLPGQPCAPNPSDFCCAFLDGTVDTCVPGNCCNNTDCLHFGANYTCQGNTCTTCAAASAAAYYVDPVYGSDTAGTGANAQGCAFKTITRALQAIGASSGGSGSGAATVLVLATGAVSKASSETFPIVLPGQVKVAGATTPATVLVTSGSTGFTLAQSGSGLSNLVVDGQSQTAVEGVVVTAGTSSIDSVTVRDFSKEGIIVSGGALAIQAGVTSTGNGTTAVPASGMRITGGTVSIALGPSPANGAGVHFDGNTANGIHVAGSGSLSLSTLAVGAVTTSNNSDAGVYIQQQINGQTTAKNSINGLVSSANGSDGLRIFGGSTLLLRNSTLLANGVDGALVSSLVGSTNSNNDLSAIDFGSAGSPGKNTFQATANPNLRAGICLDLDILAKQTLAAEGNIFSGPIDCSTRTAFLKRNNTCTNGVDVSVKAMSATGNKIDVAMCQ